MCRPWFRWYNRYLWAKSENILWVCTGGEGKRRKALPSRFHIQQSFPPALSKMVYEHLGLPTGYHEAQSANKALKDKLQNKNKWQVLWPKLDVINTPCISFHLKNGVVQKGPLNLIDRGIKRIRKKLLNVPQRTSAEPSTSVTKRDA